MSISGLYPTLWRTCRALADRTRLEIIRGLIKKPGRTVSGVAAHHQISLPSASVCLRALNARGILASHRDGKWVFYSVAPNPLIPWAGQLVDSIRVIFSKHSDPVELIYRQSTAFTHPRRIVICHALLFNGKLSYEQIASEYRISRPALSRHLEKLQQRGFVSQRNSAWAIKTPKDHFSHTLLKILAEPELHPYS